MHTGGVNGTKEGGFAYRRLKLFQIRREEPGASTPPSSGSVQRTWRPGGGGDKLLLLLPLWMVSPSVRGLRMVLCVCFFFSFQAYPHTHTLHLGRCSSSVPQDDFDKTSHVGFFGLVGGEEGMLLRREKRILSLYNIFSLLSFTF